MTIGKLAGKRVRSLKLPKGLVHGVAWGAEGWARVVRKPAAFTREKLHEIEQPGWICSTDKIRDAWGFTCGHSAERTLEETFEFYTEKGWI